MARRRRRRTSFVEDMFELGSSGFYGAMATCAIGLIFPIILDYLIPVPQGNILIDGLATGIRQSALPYVYIGGLLVSGVSIVAMIYFLIREVRNRDAEW